MVKQELTLREAVALTQKRWISRSGGRVTDGGCGFCVKYGDDCSQCVVPKVLSETCYGLPSYVAWVKYGRAQDREWASDVLADVNKIAKYYHLKQQWVDK